jgi:hypothetical protein
MRARPPRDPLELADAESPHFARPRARHVQPLLDIVVGRFPHLAGLERPAVEQDQQHEIAIGTKFDHTEALTRGAKGISAKGARTFFPI